MALSMNSYVYVLLSLKDNKSYVGSTVDLGTRIIEHNTGKCTATKNRRPLKLMYSEKLGNLSEARKREKYFKTASGRRVLKAIIKNLKNSGEWPSGKAMGSGPMIGGSNPSSPANKLNLELAKRPASTR